MNRQYQQPGNYKGAVGNYFTQGTPTGAPPRLQPIQGSYQSVVDSQIGGGGGGASSYRRDQPGQQRPASFNQQGPSTGAYNNKKRKDSLSSVDEDELRDVVVDDPLNPDLLKDEFDDDSDLSAGDAHLDAILHQDFQRDFATKSDHEKLKSLAEKTQSLYKKALEFDRKMIDLNRQYDFLNKNLKYEETKFRKEMIPPIPNGLGGLFPSG